MLAETPAVLGADVVYGCVGKAAAWTEGVQYLRDGDGRFLEVGLAGDDGQIPFNPATQLVAKGNYTSSVRSAWRRRTPSPPCASSSQRLPLGTWSRATPARTRGRRHHRAER